ncbi:MAG: choice-of-anchor L domain-containing protein [Polyangiaceae bacterium]
MSDARTRSHLWSKVAAFAATTALLIVACSDNGLPSAGGVGGSSGQCIDLDGDGFGRGCGNGSDCDDTDPNVGPCETDQCATPHQGCACSQEGLRVSCGETVSEVDGQRVCGDGERVCNPNGTWGECIINNSVRLLPGGDPKQQTMGLGAPTSCADPCDPFCQTFPDDPGGLGDPDAGISATDSGITLPGADGSTGGQSICTGGSLGSCSHHPCESGGALSSGCDEVGIPAACAAKGSSCSASNPCCYGLTCNSGTCGEAATAPLSLMNETFSAGTGWSFGGNWQMGAANTNSADDPTNDTSSGTDRRVAGTVVNGDYGNNRDDSMLSPVVNTTQGSGPITLTFRSWRDFESGYDYARFYVSTNGGSSWTELFASSGTDRSWATMTYDLSAYRSTNFRMRWRVTSDGSVTRGGWSIDDVKIVTNGVGTLCSNEGGSCAGAGSCCSSPSCVSGVCTTPPRGCVQAICAARPSCCSGSWDATCVSMIETECGNECATDGSGQCNLCWQDDIDHDGDGYSYADGDCKDCDPKVNPGAYDLPGNAIDEDCSGIADDEPTGCDTGLPFSGSTALNYAKAVDLCRTTTAGATGSAKTWGVIDAQLIKADGTSCSDDLQRAITNRFGLNNVPSKGSNMAVFSSGTARDTNDPGYVNPNGQVASYNSPGGRVNPPAGFPNNGPGCAAGQAAYDSCGLQLTIRAPTNAQSFAYDFRFFSTEYPEWVCTQFNDTYIALYDGTAPGIPANKNISFDSSSNPVSVNIGFFDVPGSPFTTSHTVLSGTGYDGSCSWGGQSRVCGGATNFLTTTAPVKPGETITLRYIIWDTGDDDWDSTVLLDNFRWSTQPATVQTQPVPPPDPITTYSPGDFIRDYDTSSVCPVGTKVKWGHWSWTSATPVDSKIEFFVKTASTAAGLASATEYPLRFTNPPGPSSLTNSAAVARANYSGINTENGSLVVDSVLAALSQPRQHPYLRVRSHLVPTSDELQAPTLQSWNLEISCVPAE